MTSTLPTDRRDGLDASRYARVAGLAMLMPMALAGIPMMGWLLVRGIDPARVGYESGPRNG